MKKINWAKYFWTFAFLYVCCLLSSCFSDNYFGPYLCGVVGGTVSAYIYSNDEEG
jgi:hypothetical protein